MIRLLPLLFVLLLAGAQAAPPKKAPAKAAAKPAAEAAPAAHASAAEEDKGKEINGVCAACHGEHGQGGKRGEYPRIAGQRAAYLKDQLKSFRARKRINIPMYPYTQERELPDEDIEAVSEYLAAIQLPTKWPEFKDTDDALTRLEAVEKVMIIPRAEGNIENGKTIYQKECHSCHGRDGRGRGKFPMLIGQYTNYLKKQADSYVKGERPHDEEGPVGILNKLSEKDIQDILAYLTAIQDPEK
ncbi:MAG: c-type cytochrome [Betaproteobacteria bacterium]|nr:c-type cytochrome [Betaproteobacteria bacterium]